MIAHSGQVVLIDFGAARISTGAETKSLTVLLKHGYAPVEQYQTQGKQGPYTDIYAVCATMYRMLSGERPEEAIDRMARDEVIPLEQRSGISVSHHVSTAIQKGLSVQVVDRYQSLEELKKNLFTNDIGNIEKKDNYGRNQKEDMGSGRKKVWLGVFTFVIVIFITGLTILVVRKENHKIIEITEIEAEDLDDLEQFLEEKLDINFEKDVYNNEETSISLVGWGPGIKYVYWENYPYLSYKNITVNMDRERIEDILFDDGYFIQSEEYMRERGWCVEYENHRELSLSVGYNGENKAKNFFLKGY